ncbi:hypothetical protein BDV29DRAFT_165146 [Aspergillus leporis]|uniref:Uncharacterized protein n=1 Tax=Aspergillus leporis TaxID=41062 RepID=A0A5N5XES4_9EURO|nr:hypothetical protein BDV29DRAFT_165146 [Aspergillus leporis]
MVQPWFLRSRHQRTMISRYWHVRQVRSPSWITRNSDGQQVTRRSSKTILHGAKLYAIWQAKNTKRETSGSFTPSRQDSQDYYYLLLWKYSLLIPFQADASRCTDMTGTGQSLSFSRQFSVPLAGRAAISEKKCLKSDAQGGERSDTQCP